LYVIGHILHTNFFTKEFQSRVTDIVFRACLGGLRLHQTKSGAATPPICSSTVELDSSFGAEEMCLAETTTPVWLKQLQLRKMKI
jgi:hypothetical protein